MTDTSLPYLKENQGRYALMVDGAPFLILGAQCNNSSAWPDILPKVWSAMELLHVNTLEIPIYWEQFEPEQGRFDTSVIETIINQAREKGLRLILLWFATWKNGSNHYMPQWMKLQPESYPNMLDKTGQPVDSPSPHSKATLEADIKAFTAFMGFLKDYDKEQTVIMVQVQNEPGSWGTVRDYSPQAQQLFDQPVPDEVLAAKKLSADRKGHWAEIFGRDADEFFHVWHVASFIGKVAKAGKAVYPIPLYVNAAIRDPLEPGWPPKYQVGGPNDNVFDLWKAAAPAIDFLAPDIYNGETEAHLKALEYYSRPDNPLMVPETIGFSCFTRFFYSALGLGAIGYSPFGMDDTRIGFGPFGKNLSPEEKYNDTAVNFKLFKPMAREIATLNFHGKIQTAIQLEYNPRAERGNPVDQKHYVIDKTLHFDGWDGHIAFGNFSRMARSEEQPETPDGRILAAELSRGQYLLAGYHCRAVFKPAGENADRPWGYLAVEEGHYEEGTFVVERILNGDQTDWGLNFDVPKVLRVSVYYR